MTMHLFRDTLLAAAALAAFPCAAVAQFIDTFDTINPAWATNRYPPAAFASVIFDGDSRLCLTIDQTGSAANRPITFSSEFYNTQGCLRHGGITGPWTLSAQVFVSSAFNTTTGAIVQSDLWSHSGTTPIGGAYMIMGFTNASPTDPFNPAAVDRTFRFQAFDLNTSNWIDLGVPNGFVFDTWHTLSGASTGTVFEYRIDGVLVLTESTAVGDDLLDAMVQGYNFGQSGSYSVYWDNVIAAVAAPPAFTLNPSSPMVATGRSAAFNAIATGMPAPTYQWTFNGQPISGATDAILLISGATSASAGAYACVATNSVGSVTSTSAALTVTTTSNPGYLLNLSARADVGTGNNILIGGFGVTGTGTKQLLSRGVGPGLFNTFGLAGQLVTPQLVLLDNGSAIIATNIGWANAPTPGASTASESPVKAPASIMATVGAFPYTVGAADTSMVLTMPSGNNTAQVSGVGATSGIALCEIYDADTGPPPARLINISARADVGTGNNILIGGFAIGGSTAETVLIRAVGPGLTDVFGLTGTLTQPVLTLLNNSSVIIYTNTVWGGDATIAGVFPVVGAFNLNLTHQDSVLLVTIPPGNYTGQVSGLNSGTGIALCEIYEVY